jgi:glycosyltransferase involved in cell wall biosynthesis
MTKRVLIVGQHYWPETFRITDIAEGLVERGFEVDVLCGTPNYPSGKFFRGYGLFKKRHQVKSGVNIMRVPEIPRGSNSNLRISLNYLSFPFFAILYLPRILFKKYDRIITYQLSPVFMSLPAIILSKIKGVPLYFYICDFWPHSLFSIITINNAFLRKWITKMSYWHYRQGTGDIGVFKGIQTRLISEVGLPPSRTLYIPQAPEKIYEERVADRRLEKRFEGGFNIVFAGNINPAQCFDIITTAAKKVYEEGITDIRFIIIGEGMSKKWLLSEVKRLGISHLFFFEGFKPVEEIPKYQMIADTMIVALSKSSLFEYGIPAKVYSYMASSKPIVGAMDGAGKDLINSSGCGICVGSGNSEGLAEAIIRLHSLSSKTRSSMGHKGYAYYKKHFEREANLTRLIEFVFNDNPTPDSEPG